MRAVLNLAVFMLNFDKIKGRFGHCLLTGEVLCMFLGMTF
jgi:hypothetical protein